MREPTSRDGYILLLTVLVVGTVASAAASAIILLGLGVERTSFSMQLSAQAMNSAWTCMENAIATLRADLDYEGNQDRSFVYGYDQDGAIAYGFATCRIYPIGGTGNEDRTVCAEGTFGDSTTRRVEASLARILPSTVVDSWKEVDAITQCNPFTGPPPEDCGNGMVQAELSETCDDGNTFNNDGCSSVCQLEVCGDGIRQAGEECDDGNVVAGDGCTDLCESEICGDWIQSAGEECEDGNTTNGDGCSATCIEEYCGDDIVNDTNETCDDGVLNGTPNHCNSTCDGTVSPVCGNGVIEIGEECDDGAGNSDTIPDACRTDCTDASCGDGVTDTGEECDDGNTTSGDGCDTLCQTEGSPTDYVAYWKLDETNPSSTVLDSSGNGYNGTPYSADVSTSDRAPLGFVNAASRLFSSWYGSSIGVSSSTNLFPSQMTVSLWVKANGSPGSLACPISKTNASESAGWRFYFTPSTINFSVHSGNAYKSINATNWNHIVGKYNGSAVRIYVNGTEGTSGTYSSTVTRTMPLYIGRSDYTIFNPFYLIFPPYSFYTHGFKGFVDDVRIYNRILTPEEISTLAAGN